jgi:RHS repeat-associated protein
LGPVSVCIFFLVALAVGVASQAGAAPDKSTAADETSPLGPSQAVELPGRATATTRTFRLSNGERETRLYSTPVNYEGGDGEWHPIENQLEADLSQGGAFTNVANRFSVSLPKVLGTGPERLSTQHGWISAEVEGLRGGAAEVEGDAATYDAADGTSFELTSTSGGLKESIELASPASPSTIRYHLWAAAGDRAALEQDGSIHVTDAAGDPVADLPAPTVTDASPTSVPKGEPVHYQLEALGASSWILTVVVDERWLGESGRSWPVTIDPTFEAPVEGASVCQVGLDYEVVWYPWSESEGVTDTGPWCSATATSDEVGVASEWWNSHYDSELQIGYQNVARLIMGFGSLSSLSTAEITGATLNLHSASPSSNSGGIWVAEHAGGNEWSNPPYIASAVTSRSEHFAGWYRMAGLQSLVGRWAHGTQKDEGVLIGSLDEPTAGPECRSEESACESHRVWISGPGAAAEYRPYLSIESVGAAPAGGRVTSPTEGTRTARRIKLRAAWTVSGVTGVRFQYETPTGWVTIPASKVTRENGSTVSWPVATEGALESPNLFWDVPEGATPNGSANYHVRALFNGTPSAEGYTEPVEFNLNRDLGGPSDATLPIGPGTVDLLTGNLNVSVNDVTISGISPALEFTRSFNSRAAKVGEKGVLGPGWIPGTPVEEAGGADWVKIREVSETVGGHTFEYAIVTGLEGEEFAFEKEGANYIAPVELPEWTLTREGSEKLVLAEPEETQTTFSNGGSGTEYLPVTVTEAAGSSDITRMVWEVVGGNRRLKDLVAPATPGLTCPTGAELTNVGCHTLAFKYESATHWGGEASMGERLASITYYAPITTTTMGSAKVAEYSYDTKGRLSAEWDPRITPALKRTYTYETGGQLATVKPPGEEAWTMVYGTSGGEVADGRLLAVKRPSLLTGTTVAQTTIAYGVPLSGSGAPYQMGPANVAAWGQKDIPTDATAIFPPDEVPSVSPPSSYAHAKIHYLDTSGREVNVAQPGAGGGSPSISTSETNELGSLTRSVTADNRLRIMAGSTEAERTELANQLSTRRIYAGATTEIAEEFGPRHLVKLANGESVQARHFTHFDYDEEMPAETVPDPQLVTREIVGALVGGELVDSRSVRTKYNWTTHNPIEKIIDPSGLAIRTVEVYDEEGQLTEVRRPSDPEGGKAGSIRTVYYKGGTSGTCVNSEYAGLACEVLPAAQPELGGRPKVLVRKFLAYNWLREPTEISESPGGEAGNVRKVLKTYDASGRETSELIEGGGTSLPKSETVYNESNGLVASHRRVCVTSCTGFDSQATTTTYDALGRVKQYEDADGNVTTTTYDVDGRVAAISDGKGSQTYTYDAAAGLLTKVEDSAAGTFSGKYDADGNMIEEVYPAGITAQTTFNAAGERTALAYTKSAYCGSSCTWFTESVERAINGDIASVSGSVGTRKYAYDAAGRLVEAQETPTGAGCTTNVYAYDADSNRTSVTTKTNSIGLACGTSGATTRSSTYDAADRLIDSGIGYDQFGRVTSLPAADAGGTALATSYYSTGMVATQTQGSLTNSYELDATGRQRARTQAGGVAGLEIFHYDGETDSPAWTVRGSSWTREIVGIGGALAGLEENGTTYLELLNLHGDVVATAEDKATATALKSQSRADAYGVPLSGPTARFGWLGGALRRTELPSGALQMGARSYVPQAGRFLSTDPLASGENNPYAYAEGDPVNDFDTAGTKPSSKACDPSIVPGNCRCIFKAKLWSVRRGVINLWFFRGCNIAGGIELLNFESQWQKGPGNGEFENTTVYPVYDEVREQCPAMAPCQSSYSEHGIYHCEPGLEYKWWAKWQYKQIVAVTEEELLGSRVLDSEIEQFCAS